MVIPKLLIIYLVSKNFFYLGIISFGLVQSVLGFAQAPSNGQVSAGSASISQQANQTTINQTSPKAIIDWRSFSIGADKRVVFVQPNSSAITLNRVTGKEASVINGSLLANGHVWLLNSNGILIGKTGQVSVGSFLGSTQSLANEKFLAGDYRFSPNLNSGSLISNQGKIIVKDGGYAILSGEAVRNDGYIQANLGQVVLAGSKAFAIDLSGDRLISFAVTEPLEMIPADGRAIVDNTGTLRADGGQVLLTARSASQLIGQVINTSGLISAASASLVNGSIVLDGGTNVSVTVSGSLDASGKNAQEKGGAIDVMGQHLSLTSSAALDVSGDLGGGIIQIGGSWQGAANQYSPAVTNTIASGAMLNASAITKGDGGSIVAWSDIFNPRSVTQVGGNLSANGGILGGNGGFIETSGRLLDINGIRVSTKSPLGKTGNWLIDPVDTVIQSLSQSNTATTTYISSSTLLSNLATTNYTLSSSDGGNITCLLYTSDAADDIL
jgi:filamentous hemagglutinin family protein